MNPSKEPNAKRSLLALALLGAALILAAAFVLLLPAIKAKFPPKTEAKYEAELTYKTITTRDAAALSSITVSHADGERYTLQYQNGALYLQRGTAQPEAISAFYAEKFMKYATEISVEDTVTDDVREVQENLPDMGLAPPQIKVLVSYDDGTSDMLSIGYNLPSTSYYYYRWSGDDGVYLCNSGAYETFANTAELLLSITQPTITPSLIERITIARNDEDPLVFTFSTDSSGSVSGMVQSPFVYPMDAQAAKTLLNAAGNFRLGARLDTLTSDNRALYGLDTPQAVITIDQREGLYAQVDDAGGYQASVRASAAVTLTLGNKDGDFFYFCEYEGTCYRVSSLLVGTLLSADAMQSISGTPADMGGDTIQILSMQLGGGTLDFYAAYTEQVLPNNELATDENGNVLYTETVTLNGDPVSADAFDALVARLRQMTAAGTLATMQAPEGTPLWQITLTTVQGVSRTLAAYTLDAFDDRLAVNGVAIHYISKEALDIALGEFAALPNAAAE